MSLRPITLVAVFAAGVAFAVWGLGATGPRVLIAGAPKQDSKIALTTAKRPIIRMDDDRIALAGIGKAKVGSGIVAKRLAVPGTIVPDSDRVAHVSVKLSGTVAELRKNIGDDVEKGEMLAALESREVADAKSEYLSARLSNELQQDLTARDKSLSEGRAVPEQQYIKSRNAAAQTAMRLDIARQKLLALGIEDNEIAGIPQAPEGTLRLQNVRAPISGRLVDRKVELGTAVGRDNLETELFVIVDLSRVWIEMTVSSADLTSVREGQSASVSVRGGSAVGNGKIIFVSPLLDKDTRAARVVAALDNPQRAWRPGSFVTASIPIEERQVSVVAPISALQNVEGRKVVFVRLSEGFEKREVTVGERDGPTVEIVSGLAAGETIATTNTFSLKAELSKPADED